MEKKEKRNKEKLFNKIFKNKYVIVNFIVTKEKPSSTYDDTVCVKQNDNRVS